MQFSMVDTKEWALPPKLRPKAETLGFDLDGRLKSMVLVHAEVPEDAFTASILGTERVGNGVVITHDGRQVVLTIGYLITESEAIWLTAAGGQVVQGHAMAYDQVTGFGLVLPLARLNVPSLPLGSSAALNPGDELTVIGFGGAEHALATRLIARREFAGYWEYLLDEALFTAPAYPLWGGSALLDPTGHVAGIGSLLIQETIDGERFDVNLFVPVELLRPILEPLVTFGRVNRAARPWLGLYTGEQQGNLLVGGVMPDGPAHRAGVAPDDQILEVAGDAVTSLAEFYRAIWSRGDAGAEVPLTIQRGEQTLQLTLHSTSRELMLKQPQRH
jgi:S1-C subfamily serine protease